MPNNNSWEAPFPYDETNNIVQNYAEQNAQFYNNLERGYTPQQLNQAYNPPQYNASVWQAPAPAPQQPQQPQPTPAMQQFQKSQQAAERLDAEQQFAAQMEQLGFVILDVPFYTDKPERTKAAQALGVTQEKFHYIIQKDDYENTPELHVYGQDKRLYVNTNYETSRQIQNEFQNAGQKNVLQFDRIVGMNFLAGHTVADNPAILDYVKNFPNVHGVGTLKEIQEAREAYKENAKKERWEAFKNFQTQSYLKINLPDGNQSTPQNQAFVQAFKDEAKSLGVNTLWDGKMRLWKLDAPQNSQEFAILANKYGSPAQQVSFNPAQLASQATAMHQNQQPQQQQQQNLASKAMNTVKNIMDSAFGSRGR